MLPLKTKIMISIIGIVLMTNVVFATHLLSGGTSISWVSGKYVYDGQQVVGCDALTNEGTLSRPNGHLTINGVPTDVMSKYTTFGFNPGSFIEVRLENCHFQCDKLNPGVQNGDIIEKYNGNLIDSEKVDGDSIRMDRGEYDPNIIGLTNSDCGDIYNCRYGNNEDMSCRTIWHLEFYGAPTTSSTTTTVPGQLTTTTIKTTTTVVVAPTLPPQSTTTLPGPPVTTITLPGTTTTTLPLCIGEECKRDDVIILIGFFLFGGVLYYIATKK